VVFCDTTPRAVYDVCQCLNNQYCKVFIKTENTVTMSSGKPRRSIQIINRLYASTDDILNGFDIDCCCIGFDGRNVLSVARGIEAISSKINTINLAIRGNAYENRLLK